MAVVRDLYYQGLHRQVLVVVAESTGKRIEAENNARRQEILRDARMLALVVVLVWWGVSWALKPLRRLRADIRNRRPDDLTPLDASRVPSEVAPLVDAVNHHIARYRRVLDEQSHFLADALAPTAHTIGHHADAGAVRVARARSRAYARRLARHRRPIGPHPPPDRTIAVLGPRQPGGTVAAAVARY